MSSTTPIFATVSGMIFLHKLVTARNVAGSVMVVVGIFLLFIV